MTFNTALFVLVAASLCQDGRIREGQVGKDNEPTAEAILKAAIESEGGDKNLRKFASYRLKEKGTLYRNGMELPFEAIYWFGFPLQTRVELVAKDPRFSPKLTRVFDKTKGWEQDGDQRARKFTKSEVDENVRNCAKREIMHLFPLLNPRLKGALLYKGKDTVKKRPTWVVEISYKETKCTLYFDIEKSLLLKVKSPAADFSAGEKEIIMETYLDDHKDFGGLKRAATITTYSDGALYKRSEIIEITPLDKVDPKLFSALGGP